MLGEQVVVELKGWIEDRLDHGASLEEIEDQVSLVGLPEDEAEALMLYAWAWKETKPSRRLRALLPV